MKRSEAKEREEQTEGGGLIIVIYDAVCLTYRVSSIMICIGLFVLRVSCSQLGWTDLSLAGDGSYGDNKHREKNKHQLIFLSKYFFLVAIQI